MKGGQFAFAMPRGSGKTTLAESGAIHALVYGHRRFVVPIGSSEVSAVEILSSIMIELETNELLLADFPEVCYPIRCLEGIHHRANGQTLNGERTRIEWTDSNAVLPTVPGSKASGSVIRVAGITGRLRGLKHTLATGESIRPDLAIVDDPQTDESATSPAQNAKREKILNGAVLGLAGPKRRIACFMPCTVIAPGDLADRTLDRERNPVWQGERSRMVVSWPKRVELWDQYADMRKESQRRGGGGEEANEFYRANRAAMDEGAVMSWPARFNDDELSAIQNAMNLKIDRGERSFLAEYQNDPQPEEIHGKVEDLEPDAIASRVNKVKRWQVPQDVSRLTAFVDCGATVLYYVVSGWSESFGGHVVDYGTWPKQNRAYFTAADARPNLATMFPTLDETARLYAGLKALTGEILSRSYTRTDGGTMRVEKCMVDSGWLDKVVHQFCRQSPFASVLLASKGYGISAKASPVNDWQVKPGERKGDQWRQRAAPDRLVVYDTNYWKTFVAQRLQTPDGGSGGLYLFGDGKGDHQLFADHLCAEYRVRTAGRGRELEEWQQRPERSDNHWFDCLVGSAVACSVLGVKWSAATASGEAPAAAPVRKKITLSELYEAKHGKGRR